MKSALRMKIRRGLLMAFVSFVLLILVFFASFVLKNISSDNTFGSVSAGETLGVTALSTPKYFYLNKDSELEPKVSALSYLIGDLETGEIILAKNQDQKLPVASVSKLMTALVATRLNISEGPAEVSSKALSTYGGNGGFRRGEKIKIDDLLYPLLLESSNDAAEIIAEHFGRETFIKKMNEEAEKLQMSATFYEDPSGLSSGNQSSAADIFKLVGHINKEKQNLFQITRARSYSNKQHNWSNTSQFVKVEGYQGGKSGYTYPAKETGVVLFALPLGKSGNRSIGVTLLGSKDRFKDVDNILKYLKKNIYYGNETDGAVALAAQEIQRGAVSEEIKDPDFVKITLLGDIMLDRGVKNSVIKNFNGDYSMLFEKLDLSTKLEKSDIVFANLEGPASDQGKDMRNLYSFRMDPAVVPALAGAGIKILSVANNHVGDWGPLAYADTLARLKENEILYTGGGLNREEAERPAIIEKHGMKIGFLGFSDVGPNSMEVGSGKAGVLLAHNPRFEEIIKNASKQVEYLIVSLHFGQEYLPKHNARQEELAHRAVDAGAKLIVGHHPHVVEDFEVYKDSYIAYSLGNFIFDQGSREDAMEGALLEIKLGKDGGLTVKKNIIKLNSAFQPDEIIEGKEEIIKFQETLFH